MIPKRQQKLNRIERDVGAREGGKAREKVGRCVVIPTVCSRIYICFKNCSPFFTSDSYLGPK